MTVGSTVKDFRFPYGNGVIGDKMGRSWQGSDSPSVLAARGVRWTEEELVTLKQLMYDDWVARRGKKLSRRQKRLEERAAARAAKYKGKHPRPQREKPSQTIESLGSGNAYYNGFVWRPPKWKVRPKQASQLGYTENDFDVFWYYTQRDKPVLRKDSKTGPTYESSTSLIGGVNPAEPARPWNSNDDIILVNKLRAKIAGSDFDPSVFLVEWHKSLQMIFDAATRIGMAWSYGRKGNLLAASRALTDGTGRAIATTKTPARNWLELQYGWLPLLSDAQSGAQYLATTGFGFLERTYYASRGHMVHNPVGLGPGANPGEVANFSYRFYKKRIKAIIKSVDLATLSGLLDPRAAVWEAIPYSFVLDWFIPIQNYLQACATSTALKGTFVTSAKSEWGVLGVSNTANPWALTGPGKDAYFACYGNFSRRVSTSLSVPLPTGKPLRKALSLTHTLNALALLRVANSKEYPADVHSFTDIRRVMGQAGVFGR